MVGVVGMEVEVVLSRRRLRRGRSRLFRFRFLGQAISRLVLVCPGWDRSMGMRGSENGSGWDDVLCSRLFIWRGWLGIVIGGMVVMDPWSGSRIRLRLLEASWIHGTRGYEYAP